VLKNHKIDVRAVDAGAEIQTRDLMFRRK